MDTLRPILVRNAPALAAEKGIRNPWILLGELQRDLKPITLPDGTILTPPSRVGSNKKAVILGDTYDASGIIPIALDADILVHECTTGYIAELEKSSTTRTEESVRESTKAKGHSTPEVWHILYFSHDMLNIYYLFFRSLEILPVAFMQRD